MSTTVTTLSLEEKEDKFFTNDNSISGKPKKPSLYDNNNSHVRKEKTKKIKIFMNDSNEKSGESHKKPPL